MSETLQSSVSSETPRPTRNPTPDSSSRVKFQGHTRTASLMGIQIVSTGAYVPERIVTNEELEQTYGFEEGWIKKRTGILRRRYAAPGEATSDLSVKAAEQAIERAGVDVADIDLLVVGTFTPDYTCPSTSCLVQERLGINAPAMDLHAACSGFMYALVTAGQYVATGNSKLALVIGADTNSRIVNPTEMKVASLFGDGAGAVLVKKGDENQGLVHYQLGADGRGGPLLIRNVGGTKAPANVDDIQAGQQYLYMDGKPVFMWAVQAVSETIQLILDKASLQPNDVSLYLLHQANARILDHAIDTLGISPDKVLNNLDEYGNTSGGSVPLVLDQAVREGRIARGDLVMMCGFGAGLTWGTGLLKW